MAGRGGTRVPVLGLSNVVGLGAGLGHSLAVDSNGNVWSWGDDSHGQLGNGAVSSTPVVTPTQVLNSSGTGVLGGIVAVAGGLAHSLALGSNGTVWAWGDDVNGELGDGIISTVPISVPVQVSGLGNVIAIAAGQGHSLALKSDGTVWAWGYGGNGALGDNSFSNSDVPVPVSNLSSVTAIAANGPHSMALGSGGTVWTWGYNGNGELGNGNTTNSDVPVQAGTLSGITGIAGGEVQSLAVKSDGTVWAWGNNANGTLGTATTTSSYTPTQVAYLSGMSLVAAGGSHSLALVSAAPVTTTTTYGYDSLYRLTSVSGPNGTTSYSYDPVGNRLSTVLNGTTSYAYDKADRILSAGSTSYTVNANGNVVARGTDGFTYDQANRLTSATIGGATWTYTYDGDGKRTSQTVGSANLNYVYDVNKSLPDVLSDGTYTYVYGVGLTFAVDASGNLQVYHTDGLGSVRALTDNNGNVIQTYQADAFGVPTQVQGTSAQPFQFTGQQQDYNGLVYLRARYYDPSVGRFLSKDPLAGSLMDPLSLNRLTYARNNPTSFTDPSGLCLEDACVLEGAAAYWVLSGGAVVSFAALAVTAQQVSRVLSDAYVQERLQEWASSRFAVVTTFADEASGFSRASASASGRQSHGTAYAKRTYGKWVDGLSRIRPKAGRPRWALPPGQRGFVEWDPSHGGELELYDGRGNHLGVLDPNTGERIKGPVPGRTSPP